MSGADATPRGDITGLLGRAAQGNKAAFDELVPLVYDELHKIASNRLRAEAAGHTLSPTALVNEAYLQLVQQERTEWNSRAHFFAVAAMAMRRILINYAKMSKREKRGGDSVRLDLDAADRLGELAVGMNEDESERLIALDTALTQMREFNEEGADVVSYHFFGGLQFKEIAEVVGVSEVTVRRRWTAARAWLRGAIPA
jgi:RNA polymerase sigma-70 factor (ECF subfamily)